MAVEQTRKEAPTRAPSLSRNGKHPEVQLVEPDPGRREEIRRALEGAGFRVRGLESPAGAALAALLVRLNGSFEVAERLAAAHPGTPLLLLVDRVDAATLEAAFRLGAKAILPPSTPLADLPLVVAAHAARPARR
ncbi:MAG: hypothetical protein L0216_16175 [Planctomycetales bacterium]|nr:hypothetical protein [Planctomycetales bacterium]